MVAFIDDDLPVLVEQFAKILPTGKRLHDGDVDLAGGFFLAAADDTQASFRKLKKSSQPLLPLAQ